MILSDDEIKARIESPLNLLNRLKSATTTKTEIVSIPPASDKIIEDLEDKIRNGSAKSKAMNLMISAMDELKHRLPEVSKPEKLAAIAAEMSKVVNTTSQNRNEDDKLRSQIIVYAPQFINEDHFDTITVNE